MTFSYVYTHVHMHARMRMHTCAHTHLTLFLVYWMLLHVQVIMRHWFLHSLACTCDFLCCTFCSQISSITLCLSLPISLTDYLHWIAPHMWSLSREVTSVLIFVANNRINERAKEREPLCVLNPCTACVNRLCFPVCVCLCKQIVISTSEIPSHQWNIDTEWFQQETYMLVHLCCRGG